LIYYTVYDEVGNKIADCGAEIDAKFLAEFRKGTYKTNRLGWKETVTINRISPLELPTNEITVNMDGGVGGSWTVEESPKLNEKTQQPFIV